MYIYVSSSAMLYTFNGVIDGHLSGFLDKGMQLSIISSEY